MLSDRPERLYRPLVGVTMSIHKLTAGSGYDYLTRQVAAFDATAKGHIGLASYYAERGESPGAWIGSGLVGIDGLRAGDEVTAEQMRALFGVGLHPLATQRLEQLSDDELSNENIRAATRLGAPFKVRHVEPNRFQVEVARRFADQAGSTKALASQRDIRAEVAREFLRPSTAGCRRMSGSWPQRLRNLPGRRRSRSPGMT